MKRKIVSVFLALCMLMSVVPTMAAKVIAADGDTGVSGDFKYSVLSEDEKTCVITGYNGTATELTIPSQLDGYTVTFIGDYAFAECTSLTSITIPDSVTRIYFAAFYSCSSLTSVTIPDSVKIIWRQAFYNTAYYNTESNWENGVLYIGNHLIKARENLNGDYSIKEGTKIIAEQAFYNCSSLRSITIPDSVTNIGDQAIENCTTLTNVTIGNSVTSIGHSAFENCTSLKSITIPDSVTEIGWGAFRVCTSLASITIPDSVTSIGGSAFNGCTSLKSITIPDSVTSIGGSAFEGTAYYNTESNWENSALYIGKHLIALKDTVSGEYNIKEGTKTIAGGACGSCKSLINITIPDSVTSIGVFAFSGCTSLTSITISDSVTNIGDQAFENCTSLTNVTIGNSVTSIGARAFSGCTSLTNIIIPNSVTSIDQTAFSGCTSLTSITIPDSVTSIGWSAFGGCTSLKSVTIPKSVTSIGDYAFNGCDNLTIYGYSGSYAEIYANKNGLPFVVLTEPSIVQLSKFQIRFRGVGADKDFSNYKDTFDVRTVAKISQEDFRNTFGTDEEALKNITDIGFIYAAEKNVTTFDLETAKKVAEGTGTDENYIKKSVSNIQHTGDGADYIFTCIVTDVPDADKEQKGYCFAYICCNGTYYYFDDVTVMDFNALYTANKPQA